MPIQVRAQSTLVGASGEHFVMYQLLRKGYIAGLAPQGAPNADIIATNVLGKKTAVIQVKTRRELGRDGGWHMNVRHESFYDSGYFYCFVDLSRDEAGSPAVFVIPSEVVAKTLQSTYEVWLRTPGQNGVGHQPTPLRRLLPDYSRTLPLSGDMITRCGKGWMEEYRENWSILGLD